MRIGCRTRIILNSPFSILNFKREFHLHGEVAVSQVHHLGHQGGSVALAQEAGHIGLYHEFLSGDELPFQRAGGQLLRPRQSLHVPLRQQVGDDEAVAHCAVPVGSKGRLEEGQGAEIGAHVGLLLRDTSCFCRRLNGIHHRSLFHLDIILHNFQVRRHLWFQHCGILDRSALAHSAIPCHHAALTAGSSISHASHRGHDVLHRCAGHRQHVSPTPASMVEGGEIPSAWAFALIIDVFAMRDKQVVPLAITPIEVIRQSHSRIGLGVAPGEPRKRVAAVAIVVQSRVVHAQQQRELRIEN